MGKRAKRPTMHVCFFKGIADSRRVCLCDASDKQESDRWGCKPTDDAYFLRSSAAE